MPFQPIQELTTILVFMLSLGDNQKTTNMKSYAEKIKVLEENLTIHTINEIPELQNFEDFEDIKRRHQNKEIIFGFHLQENIVNNFGSTGELVMDKILSFSPFIIIMLSIVLAFFRTQYYLLFGIPLSILGMLLTTPTIMKQGSSFMGIIMITVLIAGIYYCFKSFSTGFLLLSYSIPNFLLTVNRQLNMQVFKEAILKSEIVFIYYFLRGECYFKNNGDGLTYRKK